MEQMMQSKVYKGLFIAIALASASMASAGMDVSSIVNGGGIPVDCAGCEKATNANANAVLDGIRSQTEIIVNSLDYVMRMGATLNTNLAAREATQKVMQQTDVALGAKPRPACGQYGSAGVRASASSAARGNGKALSKRAGAYNKAGTALAPGEPRRDYFVKKVLEVMDKPDFEGAETVVLGKTVDSADTAGIKKVDEEILLTTNPFPVEMPSAAEVERVKKNGTAGEKERLAQMVAMTERQLVGQTAIQMFNGRDIQQIDVNTKPGSDLKPMLNEIIPLLNPEDQEVYKAGKLSENQLDELMATYRVMSPKWVAAAMASPSPANAPREQVLMQSEMLYQMWQTNQTLTLIAKLLSIADVRAVTQAGLQTR